MTVNQRLAFQISAPFRSAARSGRRHVGFTLFEMLVTIILLSIMLSFIAPNLSGLTPKYRMRTYARQIASSIEQMRVIALVRGRITGIRYFLNPDPAQFFQTLSPAPEDNPDQPLTERKSPLQETAPSGVRIRGILLPGTRGGLITSGTVNIAFSALGTTGSHIIILETLHQGGQIEVLSVKFNSLTGVIDYYNRETDFQHHEN